MSFTIVFEKSFHVHLSFDLPIKSVHDPACQLAYSYTQLVDYVHPPT